MSQEYIEKLEAKLKACEEFAEAQAEALAKVRGELASESSWVDHYFNIAMKLKDASKQIYKFGPEGNQQETTDYQEFLGWVNGEIANLHEIIEQYKMLYNGTIASATIQIQHLNDEAEQLKEQAKHFYNRWVDEQEVVVDKYKEITRLEKACAHKDKGIKDLQAINKNQVQTIYEQRAKVESLERDIKDLQQWGSGVNMGRYVTYNPQWNPQQFQSFQWPVQKW